MTASTSKSANHQLISGFFNGIAEGRLPYELLTEDCTLWTVSGGDTALGTFEGGVKLLKSIVDGRITYQIDSITAQDDRVVAELRSFGTLINGEDYANNHLFLFRLSGGLLCSISEFVNQQVVQQKLVPLMQAAMAQQQ